jgi:hypothetical protein
MAKRGKGARKKGQRWELDCVQFLRKVFPKETVRRGLQARSGEECPDVECPILWVECKAGKKVGFRGALTQAQRAMSAGRIPVVFAKDDYCPPYAFMGLDDFLDLIEEWWAMRQTWKPPQP